MFKDGELIRDIPYDVKEVTAFYYTLSFNNDGTDYSTWTIILNDPLDPDIFYLETWEVRKKTTELNVKQIRSRQDSEGGFFKSSYDQAE